VNSYRLNERWKKGDQISIDFPMELKAEKRFNNSVALLRGPIYYSLRIEKRYDSINIKSENYHYKGSIDWQITPASSWNYGLLLDYHNSSRGFKVEENSIGKFPFADKGDPVWSSDSSKYVIYENEPPVVIKARGMKIASWILKDNSADIPPKSPVKPEGDLVIVNLVPYGCARLRITEFPVMDIYLMQDVMRPATATPEEN
jgi:hypothetical protein